MSVTAIIVTYNSAGVIESALGCVYNHPRIVDCIVVDNASEDATLDIVRLKFSHIKIIANDYNEGFGVACNQALEKVTSEFALLFNPDATIDSAGIDILLNSFSSYPNAAIIAPALTDESRTAVPVSPVKFISGAVAMWKMNYMKRVGFFDPAFFLFYEDDDISIRTLKAGYDLLLVTGINAQHNAGTSCALTEELKSLKLRSSTWSHLYILSKHRGKIIAKTTALFMIILTTCKKTIYTIGITKAEVNANEEYGEASAIKHSEKQAVAEREHERKRVALVKAYEERWKVAMKEHKGELAIAAKKHEEQWAAASKKLEEEWAVSAKKLEEEWAAATKKLEKHMRAVQKKQENADKLWAALYFMRNSRKFK